MNMWAFLEDGTRVWSSENGWEITVTSTGDIQGRNASSSSNISVSDGKINVLNASVVPFDVMNVLVRLMEEQQRFGL